MSAHNVYYVKCNVVLNNVIFDSCLFPHQHYDRHSFHARECCAIRQNVRGDKSKLNGVLKPNAAGFHVDRLCLTSPFPCIW